MAGHRIAFRRVEQPGDRYASHHAPDQRCLFEPLLDVALINSQQNRIRAVLQNHSQIGIHQPAAHAFESANDGARKNRSQQIGDLRRFERDLRAASLPAFPHGRQPDLEIEASADRHPRHRSVASNQADRVNGAVVRTREGPADLPRAGS